MQGRQEASNVVLEKRRNGSSRDPQSNLYMRWQCCVSAATPIDPSRDCEHDRKPCNYFAPVALNFCQQVCIYMYIYVYISIDIYTHIHTHTLPIYMSEITLDVHADPLGRIPMRVAPYQSESLFIEAYRSFILNVKESYD